LSEQQLIFQTRKKETASEIHEILRCVYANETVPHAHVLVWLKIQRRTWRPERWFKERAAVNFSKFRNICDVCEPVETRDLRMTLNSTNDQLHINRGTIN